MKAEIVMDPATKSGILRVAPETPMEAYALYHWWQNYDKGEGDSLFQCNYDKPIPAPKTEA